MIVKNYTNIDGKIDVKAVLSEKMNREDIVSKLGADQGGQRDCVIWFQSRESDDEMTSLLNDLALKQGVNFVSGKDPEILTELRIQPKKVILLKKVFKKGTHLEEQIEALKEILPEAEIKVFCLFTSVRTHFETFVYQQEIEGKVLFAGDDYRSDGL